MLRRFAIITILLMINLMGDEMKNVKNIVLAGGCFWGTEAYIKKLPGVLNTYTGYANSDVPNPDYKLVCTGATNAAEAVYVEYNEMVIDLEHLLKFFFYTIDPTSLNKQGGDKGTQYRTGIYYTDESDLEIIKEFITNEQRRFKNPIVVEILPLKNIYKAEEYHQDYLDKNPHGYCHVTFQSLPKKDEILSKKGVK